MTLEILIYTKCIVFFSFRDSFSSTKDVIHNNNNLKIRTLHKQTSLISDNKSANNNINNNDNISHQVIFINHSEDDHKQTVKKSSSKFNILEDSLEGSQSIGSVVIHSAAESNGDIKQVVGGSRESRAYTVTDKDINKSSIKEGKYINSYVILSKIIDRQ